jgi:hypothetical protein
MDLVNGGTPEWQEPSQIFSVAVLEVRVYQIVEVGSHGFMSMQRCVSPCERVHSTQYVEPCLHLDSIVDLG